MKLQIESAKLKLEKVVTISLSDKADDLIQVLIDGVPVFDFIVSDEILASGKILARRYSCGSLSEYVELEKELSYDEQVIKVSY